MANVRKISPHSEGYQLRVDWQADGAGAVAPFSIGKHFGYFHHAVIWSGPILPTNNYDIHLHDKNGRDVYGTAMEDLNPAILEKACPICTYHNVVNQIIEPALVADELIFEVHNNLVPNASGTVIFYFRKRD